MTSLKKYFIGVILILVPYFIFALTTYKSYGITSDEPLEYTSGKALLVYYKTFKDPSDISIPSVHLPTQSTYMRIYPALLVLLNSRGYYEWFHLLNLLFGSLIFVVVYSLIFYRYKSLKWSLLAALFLFLTPRFLGDIPANPKDFPFAVLYLISLCLIYFNSKIKVPFALRVIVMGIVFGLTQSSRLLGASLYFVHILYTFSTNRPKTVKEVVKYLSELTAIFLISLGTMTLTLPLLITDPVNGFIRLITTSSKFENWNNTVFFDGRFLMKDQRPWFYLPVWLLISTPIYQLVLGFVALIQFVRNKFKDELLVLLFGALITNLALYLIIEPVIYNGLRHFLFLLPIISLISLIGLYNLKGNFFYIALLLLAVNLLSTSLTMSKLHPYEYIYFNGAVGGLAGAHNRYETDYWGASYKEATEELISYLNGKTGSKVYPCELASSVAYYSQQKFEIVSKSRSADYIICEYEEDKLEEYTDPVVTVVSRSGVPINIIRKVQK